MKADFSRLTFDPAKHYAGVLHQQGRVWLDSDWNEDIFERLHLLEEETFDIIGACGVPDPHTAFAISANNVFGDFAIAGGPGPAGRYYVDGILCQLDQPTTYLKQPDYPDPPALPTPAAGGTLYGIVYLEVWRRLITYLEDDALREIALGGPDTATRLKTIAQVKVWPFPPDMKDHSCDKLPAPGGAGTLTTIQPTDTQPPDPCRLPDPANYTGRENHLYRVEIHDGGEVIGSGNEFTQQLNKKAAAGDTTLTLANPLANSQQTALIHSGAARLFDDDGQNESVTVISISGTTLTLASPLVGSYTTDKHATLTNIARFKWSRDNAAFAVRVKHVEADRQTLTLTSLGRDQATALRAGDLVEICDDASELGPARGHLTRLSATPEPDPDLLTVKLIEPLPDRFQLPPAAGSTQADRHMILRRWDGLGQANVKFDAATTPDMDFGDGVHIHFGGSDLRSGDYWQFTARALDGSVERLTDAPPMGIIRHVCPLALIHWNQAPANPDGGSPGLNVTWDEDCRQPFNPLTKQHGDCACDCTVAVAPGDSLAEAVKKIGPFGGVICLLPGLHTLTDTVTIQGKNGLTIRGAGAAVIMVDPQVATALLFQDCKALTLRDFGVVRLPGANITNAASVIAPITGLVTFVDCQVVEVSHCLIVSGEIAATQGQQAGILFYPSASAASLAGRMEFHRQFGLGAAPLETFDRSHVPASPIFGAGIRAALSQGRALPGLDLTIRDCRFFIDVGQSGVFVADSLGITIEDNKLLPFFAIEGLQGNLAQLAKDLNRRGALGLALDQVASVIVANNLTVGFETAVGAIALGEGLEGTDVTICGNSGVLCGIGVASLFSGVLRLSENSLAVDKGPAVYLKGSAGKVLLEGNDLTSLISSARAVGGIAEVADLQAPVAVLANNSFQTRRQMSFPYAVRVQGTNITYSGNQSVCMALPTYANVILQGQGQEQMTSITALCNTCREPPPDNFSNLHDSDVNIEGAQNDLLISWLGSTTSNLQQLEHGLAAINKRWDTFNRTLTDDLLKQQHISLLAMAGVAITGANLLSYQLVRSGRGSDQGSEIGVF